MSEIKIKLEVNIRLENKSNFNDLEAVEKFIAETDYNFSDVENIIVDNTEIIDFKYL